MISLAYFSELSLLIIVDTYHKKSQNPLQKLFARYFNVSVGKVAEIITKSKKFEKTLNLKVIKVTELDKNKVKIHLN